MAPPDSTQDGSETADYRPYAKGPNFLGIVIGCAVAILVIAAATLAWLHYSGRHMFPMKTRATPSQTRLAAEPDSMRRAA